MNFELHWDEDALAGLAAVWLDAPDRAAVTLAQRKIDQRLASDPYGCSVPLSEGLYAIDVSPLRAVFEVSDADRRVNVVSVGRLK